jgi:hypothetical protein
VFVEILFVVVVDVVHCKNCSHNTIDSQRMVFSVV